MSVRLAGDGALLLWDRKLNLSRPPLQITTTTTMNCKAITTKRWYQDGPAECKLAAWKDGFCRQHHPANRARADRPGKELAAARKSLESAKKKVEHWAKRIAELEIEKLKWDRLVENFTPENK